MVLKFLVLPILISIPAVGLAAGPAPAISNVAATHIALAAVPHGIVKSSELETEHDRLIYSYDIAVPGKTGVEEIQVDAMTGRIVSKSHEGPLRERAEALLEQREHKK